MVTLDLILSTPRLPEQLYRFRFMDSPNRPNRAPILLKVPPVLTLNRGCLGKVDGSGCVWDLEVNSVCVFDLSSPWKSIGKPNPYGSLSKNGCPRHIPPNGTHYFKAPKSCSVFGLREILRP